jgi:hypothetical protein
MKTFVNSNLNPPTIEQFVDKVNTDSDFAKYWGPGGKEQQKQLITEIMDLDAKDGLYDTVNDTVTRCPKCNSEEVEAMTPRTIYSCGSSDYDQRPGTFLQSDKCKQNDTVSELDKLAYKYNPVMKLDAEFIRAGFKAGYKKAKETLYTEEQVRMAIEHTLTLVGDNWSDIRFCLKADKFTPIRKPIEEFIQSLKLTKK